MTEVIEKWLPVVGFNWYRVSNMGRVISKVNPGNHRYEESYERALSLKPNKYGYVVVNLHNEDERMIPKSVHSLVMEAFVGPRPTGLDIRHKNGDRSDNRLENLEYGTRKENMEDAKHHGNLKHEEKHHNVKVTREDAVQIIELCYNKTHSQRAIASMFGISQQGVSDIFRGKCWRSLDYLRPEKYRSDSLNCRR